MGKKLSDEEKAKRAAARKAKKDAKIAKADEEPAAENQDNQDETPNPDKPDQPDKNVADAKPEKGMVKVKLLSAGADPLPVYVNGKGLAKLKVGVEEEVSQEVVDALINADGIVFEINGKVADNG